MLSVLRSSVLKVNVTTTTIPSILSQWLNGILLASPKSKTSHMKKRSRMLGGSHSMKNAQPWNNLNRCPSCGHYKRAHTLCMYCVGQIRYIWKNHLVKEESNVVKDEILDEIDKRIIYPDTCDTPEMRKLKDKDSYLVKRKRTLPYEK
ncbi:large ribosomal subunit protein bL32m [Monosporozyma unispora]